MKKITLFSFTVLIFSVTTSCSKGPCYLMDQNGQYTILDRNCDGIADHTQGGGGGGFDPGAPAIYPITQFVIVTNVAGSTAYTNGGASQFSDCNFVPAGYPGQPGTVSEQNVQMPFQTILTTGFLGTGGRALVDQNLLNRAKISMSTAKLAASMGVTMTNLLNQGRSAQLRDYLNQPVLIAILETGNAPGGVYGASSISQDQECLVAPYIYHQVIGFEIKKVKDLFYF